jgi:hypothetical protein
MSTDIAILDRALAYAASGKPVFPCGADKRPLTAHGFKDASTDPGMIREWWTRWPDALIGLPTGAWCWVLDIDIKHGQPGAESLADLIRAHGQLPETRTAKTQSGGTHYYFQPVEAIACSAGYTKDGVPHGVADGIDVRARGGYVIAPPSPGYEWIDSDDETPIAAAPDWLVRLAIEGRAKPKADKPAAQAAQTGGVGEGGRNAHLTSMAGRMRRGGFTSEAIAAALKIENGATCKPPLADNEVQRIAASVGRYDPAEAEDGTARAATRGPRVILPSIAPGDETVTVPRAAADIYGVLKNCGLFMRGGRLHELKHGEDGELLEPLSVHDFIARVPKYCDMFAWRCPKDEPVLKPVAKMAVDCAQAIMATSEAVEILPPVAIVLRCAGVVERDGTLATMRPGYNPERGGMLVAGRVEVPVIPEPEAWAMLAELVIDFDFLTPSDRSRCLAGFITPALRFAGLIPGHVPVDVVEADKSQTGKTYKEAMRAKIYGEPLNCVAQRVGGVGSLDETISQKLIDGRPFIMLDNTRGKIDSTMLEAILTPTGPFSARVPHRGEVSVDPRRFIFSLTSNGAELTRDLANRACVVRLRKRPPGIRWKRFQLSTGREGDVLAWIEDQQPRLLGAVHAICRAWYSAGRPATDETRHSFRGWAGILDWIVREHGEAPLLDGHTSIQERVGDPGLAWLRAVAMVVARRSTPSWSASRLAEVSAEHGIAVPNCRPEADERGQAKAVGVTMRRLLAEADQLEVDGVMVTRRTVRDAEGRERPEYAFSPDSPNPGTPEGLELQEKRGCFSRSIDPSGVPGTGENRGFCSSAPAPSRRRVVL